MHLFKPYMVQTNWMQPYMDYGIQGEGRECMVYACICMYIVYFVWDERTDLRVCMYTVLYKQEGQK